MHPGAIPHFDITEKNSMWLAEFRKKNIKGLSSKIFQFSEAEVAANFDITPTSIHVQRFTGHVYDWVYMSILNDWPIQKIDLLTSACGSLCNIAKYLTHAVPTCKMVKLMVKVWFSVLIYQTFKAFKEAMKYLIWSNNNKIEILKIDNFSEVLVVMIMNFDYIFAPFVLFFVGKSKKIHFLYISSDVTDGLTPLQLNKIHKIINSFWLKV